jgi:hypothetical protein
MVATTPIVPPPVTTAVVAPAPQLKQARVPQAVKTETLKAVDAPERGEHTSTVQRRRPKGEMLDVTV